MSVEIYLKNKVSNFYGSDKIMAIDSENNSFKSFYLPQQESDKSEIPENRAVPHDFRSLIRNARRQIEHYINQIVYHPEKKSLYIEKINEIIIDEFSHGRGFVKNE